MRKLLIICLTISLAACGTTRNVSKTNERIKLVDKGVVQRTAPGERVYITIPATPNERPRSQTKTYSGEKGARTDVTFDQDGTVTNINTDCPEINEIEQKNLEMDYSKRERDSERQFNMELAKIGQSTILILGGIFAVAWVIRGILAKP